MTILGFCITPFVSITHCPQDKPECNPNRESSMEQIDTLSKGSSMQNEHEDVSNDEVSGSPWDAYAAYIGSNAPTSTVTYTMNTG